MRALVVVVPLLLAACSRAQIPYDFAAVKSVGPEPKHAKKIALLPLTDARSNADGADNADHFEYQGIEFAHTKLDQLGAPLERITELVGRHLAASRTFSQVLLVLTPEQAPEADLLLAGRVRRMRGYVEANEPSPKSGRPKEERIVLAEVVLDRLEVRDAKHPEKILFTMDAGWSLYEPRLLREGVVLEPWSILSEALFHAVNELVDELGAADLSGALVVQEKVELTLGGENPPAGWKTIDTSTASRPIGWRSREPRCTKLALEQMQTKKFHRVLGSYRPQVIIWTCPRDLALDYDARVEFPARYLGEKSDGRRYFVHALGESNWPTAIEDILKYFEITPPRKRHVFSLPAS